MTTAAIEEAKRASADIKSANAVAEAERGKLLTLRRQKTDEAEERLQLREAEDADAAKRLLDGDGAAPDKPRRRNRLAKLDENAPVLSAAIKLQESRVAEAEAAIAPLQVPLVAASLRIVADVQGDAIAGIREVLGQLAPLAAHLLAADQIMAATVGTGSFPVPRGAPMPIKGSQLLSSFLKGIPEPLRPDSLKTDELGAAAHAISQPIISEVKGNQND
ncbi:hypothetical protein A0J57_14035 [Sphingobium sp. 22B]|uniref:hypothetical protein n=1 Tax=unclassified Sphingobium TaxID=2611147 RepID=UPI0007820261|nr:MULTISPECIES: hypothetical protein [unclassified Sphingobium]KXU30936.1 hypothetical protein AXW74_15135 [Sphingobium sp. AM]KYC31738.1 hypothetical protein A0J57_14035 [Sphingobium sp. 22B]OAP31060.1 hypothetical protein A8O16_15420 [Sphingobium sp. 20006FA]